MSLGSYEATGTATAVPPTTTTTVFNVALMSP